MSTYEDLESRIIDWCHDQPTILAAVAIGSRGRLSPPPDDSSDLDLILFVNDPARYTDHSDWIEELGAPWITVLNHIGRGDPEWLILFQGGLKADLLLISAKPDLALAGWLKALPYQQLLGRGARIIYDAGAPSEHPVAVPAQAIQRDLPSQSELDHTVGNALFTAERMSKFIKRKDNWRIQSAFCELREHLLTLIEWHARSTFGAEHDIWYEGRHMEAWADGRIMAVVGSLSPGHGRSSQVATLLSALELIEWLVTEIAAHTGYPLPTIGQRKTLGWLKQNLGRGRD